MSNLEPITRKEKYLAAMCRMSCMECDVPDPISREEKIFDYILGNQLEKPKCITRSDRFLMRIADSDMEVPDPITRYERFLSAASGDISPECVPTPLTKTERYLMEYATTEEVVDSTTAYSKSIQAGASNLATFSYIGGKSYVQDGELLSASSKKVVSQGRNIWNEEWEQGTFSLITGEKVDSNLRFRNKNLIPCVPNKKYYYHCTVPKYADVLFYDAEGNYLSNQINGVYPSAASPANYNNPFTTPNNCYYIAFSQADASESDNQTSIVQSNVIDDVYYPYMIEEMKTDYGILKSAGSVYDYVDFGKRSIVRKVGTYTPTGTENWLFVDEGENTYRCRIAFSSAKNNGQGICTEAQWVTTGVSLDQEVAGVVGGQLYYRIAKTKLDEVSVEGFKNYLSEHQVTFNYELAEPIEEPITIKDKNILVEGGGSLTFVSDQEANIAVPSTVTYRKKK